MVGCDSTDREYPRFEVNAYVELLAGNPSGWGGRTPGTDTRIQNISLGGEPRKITLRKYVSMVSDGEAASPQPAPLPRRCRPLGGYRRRPCTRPRYSAVG